MPTFMGFHMPRDGYGYGTIKLATELAQGPEPWEIVDMCGQAAPFDRGLTWRPAGDVVALCQPDWLTQIVRDGRLAAYTMFEATTLPQGWAETLNARADAVVVPCRWNAEVFYACGVRRPLHVVKWGVDGADWPLVEQARAQGPYTFLWSGTPDRRKGYDLAYECFVRAFGHDMDVRLVMHFRQLPRGLRGVRDPNVRLVEGLLERPALRALLAGADCFVFPSRGEGWGAPPREAAAMGLPVIATDWGGLAEDIGEWAYPLRVAGLSRAEFGWYDDVGEWAEPDPEHLVALLRGCYAQQAEAAQFGRQAAAWLREHATWSATAQQLRALMA